MQAPSNSLLDAMGRARHEQVLFCSEPSAGLRAIIAIHSTRLGPSLGGCRMYPYGSEQAAIEDVLRLSQGMTYKAAISGLALGGGKAVIIADPKVDKSAELWRAFGRFVDTLGGRYITAEDVGTSPEDMALVRAETRFAVGSPSGLGGSGDPSPMTALGVLSGMRAAAAEAFGSAELVGRKVAVQGCGHVGSFLCRLLVAAGAEVVVSDVDEQAASRLSTELGLRTVAPEGLLSEPCDILAPCAMGGILNEANIANLRCQVVAGAANNQLANEVADSERLVARGIVYAPDYVINAGGLINVSHELDGYDKVAAEQQTRGIFDVTERIFAHAASGGMTPAAAAKSLADKRLLAATVARPGAAVGRGLSAASVAVPVG